MMKKGILATILILCGCVLAQLPLTLYGGVTFAKAVALWSTADKLDASLTMDGIIYRLDEELELQIGNSPEEVNAFLQQYGTLSISSDAVYLPDERREEEVTLTVGHIAALPLYVKWLLIYDEHDRLESFNVIINP